MYYCLCLLQGVFNNLRESVTSNTGSGKEQTPSSLLSFIFLSLFLFIYLFIFCFTFCYVFQLLVAAALVPLGSNLFSHQKMVKFSSGRISC